MHPSANIILRSRAYPVSTGILPHGRLGQDLGFGGIAFALKLPELLNRNLAAVRANILFP